MTSFVASRSGIEIEYLTQSKLSPTSSDSIFAIKLGVGSATRTDKAKES